MTQKKCMTLLLQEIETNRRSLNKLAITEDLQSKSIITQSQKLDKLITKYQYMANKR